MTTSPAPFPLTDPVTVGAVVNAHGNDGRIRIHSQSDNPRRFERGSIVSIGNRELRIQHVQHASGDHLILQLAGVSDRSAAMTLKGEAVLVARETVPDPPTNTYYHYQLIDMAVFDEAGHSLGKLTEVIHTGANDVYVVTSNEAELLIPALESFVLSVDATKSTMPVAVIEGLEWRPLNSARPKATVRRKRRTTRPEIV